MVLTEGFNPVEVEGFREGRSSNLDDVRGGLGWAVGVDGGGGVVQGGLKIFDEFVCEVQVDAGGGVVAGCDQIGPEGLVIATDELGGEEAAVDGVAIAGRARIDGDVALDPCLGGSF